MKHTAPSATPDGPADGRPASVPLPAAAPSPGAEDADHPPPEPYDPADYRWVPVRRRPRYDGWTEEKQRRFIEVLADTGLVSVAAKAVGMTRESAYKLRRAAHGAAFSRAWDAARHHAGSFLEDIAFESAIEGVEHNVYNEYGDVVCTKRVYNDRLLIHMLRHLKPERYGREAQAQPPVTVEASLREMEPQLPAPPEALLDPDTLDHELTLADAADGQLPSFLSEQRPEKSAKRQQAEAQVAQDARAEAAMARMRTGKPAGPNVDLDQELRDITRYLDPASVNDRGRKRYR
jgi:hypothetical protein